MTKIPCNTSARNVTVDREQEQIIIDGIVEDIFPYYSTERPYLKIKEDDIRSGIRLLLDDHSEKSADELADMANKIVFGRCEDRALLICRVRDELPHASQILLAAAIRRAWHGRQAGNILIPDAALTSPEAHLAARDDCLAWFDPVRGDPRRILTNDIIKDLDFFDHLPKCFTVYRGCYGMEPHQAAAGICWTTKRENAEWFAHQHPIIKSPVVVSARITKTDVYTVFAETHEIICRPDSFRTLKVRPTAINDLSLIPNVWVDLP